MKGKQYTVAAAPPDLREMGMTPFGLGQRRTGMLFVNVLTSDPYEQLMEGVNSCSYAGKEKVGDVEAHHLKFTQDASDWEMWVAAEGKPLVLKMATVRSMEGSKLAMVESYRNWKLDVAPGKDVFSFLPPKDAKKVQTLNDENEPRSHAQDDAAKRGLAKLQGRWEMVSSERDGIRMPADEVKTYTRTISGNMYTVVVKGETRG